MILDILLSLIVMMILIAIPAAWIYAYFLLMDSGKIYYQIFAVIMTGIFGAIILEVFRRIYNLFV